MIYRDFQDPCICPAGFGTMRLPPRWTAPSTRTPPRRWWTMRWLLASIISTPPGYMQNLSETVVGRCLKKASQDSFYLATKYPGHTLTCDPGPADTFAQQLEKCQVDYFDFYLLHNVYENDVDIYTDPRVGASSTTLWNRSAWYASSTWAFPPTRAFPASPLFWSAMARRWSSVRSS